MQYTAFVAPVKLLIDRIGLRPVSGKPYAALRCWRGAVVSCLLSYGLAELDLTHCVVPCSCTQSIHKFRLCLSLGNYGLWLRVEIPIGLVLSIAC